MPRRGRIAVVGAGRMGSAMVGRLRGAGESVSVFNRNRGKADQVAHATGADVADTAAEAAAGADVVLVSLADDAAVRAVYTGTSGGDSANDSPPSRASAGSADGLVAGLADGAVVVETSTVAPTTVRELAGLVESRSATLLDAPVSGSVPLVARGELTFMVGGDSDALERVRPILDLLSKRVFHLGGVGTGATMKLSVNSALHGHNQALAEALVLAEKAGVERSAAYEVFASSALASPFVQYKREAYENPDSAPAAFTLDLVAKDLTLIADLATDVGARMDQLAANRRLVDEAVESGLADADMSALAHFLR